MTHVPGGDPHSLLHEEEDLCSSRDLQGDRVSLVLGNHVSRLFLPKEADPVSFTCISICSACIVPCYLRRCFPFSRCPSMLALEVQIPFTRRPRCPQGTSTFREQILSYKVPMTFISFYLGAPFRHPVSRAPAFLFKMSFVPKVLITSSRSL